MDRGGVDVAIPFDNLRLITYKKSSVYRPGTDGLT